MLKLYKDPECTKEILSTAYMTNFSGSNSFTPTDEVSYVLLRPANEANYAAWTTGTGNEGEDWVKLLIGETHDYLGTINRVVDIITITDAPAYAFQAIFVPENCIATINVGSGSVIALDTFYIKAPDGANIEDFSITADASCVFSNDEGFTWSATVSVAVISDQPYKIQIKATKTVTESRYDYFTSPDIVIEGKLHTRSTI